MTRTKKSRHTGGTVKVRCNTQHWKDVWRFANEHIAVSQIDKMDSPPVGPIRLMDLKMVGVAGIVFVLTLRIRGIDGLTVDYRAHVFYRYCDKGWEVKSFSKIEGSERGRQMPMLVSGEHMRIKNPFWSYKKVLKAAKGKWRKLTELEKVRFMGEATKKDLKGKQKVSPKEDLEGEQKASPR